MIQYIQCGATFSLNSMSQVQLTATGIFVYIDTGCDVLCAWSYIPYFSEVRFSDVRRAIDQLKNKSTVDCFYLNVKLIKTVKNLIIISLTKLIHFCLGVMIKRRFIIRFICRSVSVLPCFNKIFESVLSRQIMEHLNVLACLLILNLTLERNAIHTTDAVSHY